MSKKQLVLATKNEHKIKELRSLLKPLSWEVLTYTDIDYYEDIEETGDTFIENATVKASAIAEHSGILTVSDDSGLEVDFLDGRPGVKSARFISEKAGFDERNLKILELLKDVPGEKRTARFICVAVMAWPEGYRREVFKGVCEGRIAFSPSGTYGFGYDPIFYLPNIGKTMAELEPDLKNKISHRAMAFNKMIDFLKSL